MKGKFITQITAFAMAICMLVALVPAVPAYAADGDDTAKITLNFDLGTFRTKVKEVTSDGTAYGSTSGGWNVNKEQTAGSIRYHLENTDINTNVRANWYVFVRDASTGANPGLRFTFLNNDSDGQKIAFDFQVEKAGWYDLKDSSIGAYIGAKSAKVSVLSQGVTSEAATLVAETAGSGWIGLSAFETKAVYLNAGTNTVVFEGTATDVDNTFLVKELIFTETDAPKLEKKVTLNFNLYSKLTKREGLEAPVLADASMEDGGWVLNTKEELTDRSINSAITSKDSHLLYKFIDSGEGARVSFQANTTNRISFDFNVEEAGYYDLTAEIYSLKNLANDITVYVKSSAAAKTQVGVIDARVTGDGWVKVTDMPEFKTVYLSEGTNTIMLTADPTKADYIAVKSFTFTKKSDVAANTNEVFGNIFAYIKKTDGGVKVSFVGGIKTIEGFEKVGFKVGNEEYTTQNVYKNLSAKGTSFAAADFGVGENGYIFHTDYIDVEAGDVVTIEAFAVKSNGDEVKLGKQYNVTIK